MAKSCVFVFLVCFALASYASGQESDSDQCSVYRQGYPAYYTCIIKCFQFVLGFNDSTASLCTNKFRLTKASRTEYTNTHAVNCLKCIAIKCKELVPKDVCEDSSPGIGSSTDFSDFTTAFSTTTFVDDANSGISTSAPSSSGATVEDSTSPGLLSISGDSVNTPPSFINAGTPSASLSPDNSVPSTTPSTPADDASQILLSNGEEQPSDSEECDEDGDDMGDDTSSGASITDLNPYYTDEGCNNSPSPDDGSSASDTSANSGGDSSSASAASDSNSEDDSSAKAASESSGGDSSSASAASATNDGDNSSANAASSSNSGDDSSANAASDSSDGDSSASAASAGGGDDSASAGASSPDNDGDDSSANSNSDLDFFYYFLYDDDDEQSNSTFKSNSNNASATKLFSTSVQPVQSTPQPSIVPISSDSGDFPESPDDTPNDDMSPGDETSDNQPDAGKKYYDYAEADAVAGNVGSGSNTLRDSQGGNNNPQVPQNPSRVLFGSNPPQSPVYYPPQAPAYNLKQVRGFNNRQAQAFNPQQAQAFNPQQAQAFNPQQAQAFNPQQGQAFNPQQVQTFNPQQAQTFNSQAQEFNSQQAQAYNQQAPVYNSQQESAYNSEQMPNWNNNNNNWNYAQQNRRQRIPIRNKWIRRQQGLFPANNQGYQWDQGDVNNNRGQENPANIPSANNGRFLRNRGNFANNVDY